MARTRRKMPARRARRRADWVFRPDLFDSAAGNVDANGTYSPFAFNLPGGLANARWSSLYDSNGYLAFVANAGAGNVGTPLPRAARAEGRRPYVKWVRGKILLQAATWTVGSIFRLGIRFGVWNQNPASGNIIVSAAYSMWNATTLNDDQVAVFANDGEWQKEVRMLRTFSTGNEQTAWEVPVSFPVRRSLRPNQAYGVYLESTTGSATLAVQYWLQTLVADED